ncbi:MAG: protein FlhF [Deltaproteobacteria bacterium]|nr:MAG: protein FlhF [Deltaproteobacteria bacterium]
MQVRKYRGKSIREASLKVKESLGPEAMIVSTRRIYDDGGACFEICAVPMDTGGHDPFSELKAELTRIREMIQAGDEIRDVAEALVGDPAVMDLYARLLGSGLESRRVRYFLERSSETGAGAIPGGSAVRRVEKEIMRSIEVTDPFATDNGGRVVAALVGTTGVGKTTTIAKLAARLMLGAKKDVGLISIDTYRVGAIEQLRAYADILGIPCYQAFKRKDLAFALRRMAQKDVVLIDTAGRSQYDTSRIRELKRMMTLDQRISVHLLLSASTRRSEMRRTVESFMPLNLETYIFTKIDETGKIGPVVNQIMETKFPVSYLTNGQNVPDDIERASRERILARLLSRN